MSEVYIVTGPSCPNCTMLKQIIKHLKLPEPTEVTTDSLEGRNLIRQTKSRSIPILARVEDGEAVEWIIGSHNPDDRVKSVYES